MAMEGVGRLVVLALCISSAAAFSGGSAGQTLRLLQGANTVWARKQCVERNCVSVARQQRVPRTVAQASGDGQAADGNRLLDLLEFVIGTTFKSRLYVGSPQLHVAVPLPRPDTYPDWIPGLLRLPKGVYDWVDKGVDDGWIKRAPEDCVFEIKYGVLRGEVSIVPDEKCEPCELEKRKQLEQDAARDLVNIGANERTRRMNAGYTILATSSLAAYLAIDLDGGPLFRFPAAFLAVLGYAFIESGKNGL